MKLPNKPAAHEEMNQPALSDGNHPGLSLKTFQMEIGCVAF